MDLQEGMQNDNQATCSAVFPLLYALIRLLCSLFPMYVQDSAGRNREFYAAAQSAALVWVTAS